MKPNWSTEGWEKIKKVLEKNNELHKDKWRKKYEENPSFCRHCGIIIPFEKKDNVFCNHSCAATFNNLGKEKKYKLYCLYCGEKTKRNRRYCNKECGSNYRYFEFINKWKQGLENGRSGLCGVRVHIRRYLFDKYKDACCKCGWKEVNPKTEKIPLQVSHIDGNYKNNKEDNLELLCPNCHSLTDTYGSLNKGNGREYRYMR